MNRFISTFGSLFLRLGPVGSSCLHRTSTLAVGLGVLSGAISTASAQSTPGLRLSPPSTQRETLAALPFPDTNVNGWAERLSRGARLYGPDNLILLSSAVVGQNLLVNFVREPHALIREVWILTPAEAATPAPVP